MGSVTDDDGGLSVSLSSFLLPPRGPTLSHRSAVSPLSYLATVFCFVVFFFLLFYRSCCKSPLDCIHCQHQGPQRPLIRPLEPRWASPPPLLKKAFNLTPARQSRQQTKTSSGPVRMTAGTRGGRFLHFRMLKIEFPGILQLNPVTKTSWKNWKN